MKEPTDTLDWVVWMIFGDFLSDAGEEEREERARCIGTALKKYPEGLHLIFDRTAKNPTTIQAACSRVGGPALISGGITDYEWSEIPGDLEDEGACFISPLSCPQAFVSRQDLIPAFWDKLAEIGKSLRLAGRELVTEPTE